MRARHDEPKRLALILLMLAFAPQAEAARAGGGATQTTAAAAEEMWLAVAVNGQVTGTTTLVRYDHAGHVWVGETDLRNWRLPCPAEADTSVAGTKLYSLTALPGLRLQVDETRGTLAVEAPAALFDSVSLAAKSLAFRVPDTSPLGGFFNYDAVVTRDSLSTSANALLEAGVFGRLGTVTTRFVERQWQQSESTTLTRQGAGLAAQQSGTVRLESTWTWDRPESATSLRVGDSITGASRWWGGAVRFGGLQWGTNFSTQPGLVTMPLPSVAGESALPSTLELYVDGALRMRQDLPEGPFTLRDVPVTNGDGQIRVVVRDLLGREQVISQSYYASARMLRPGLHDYSFELGAVREDFGLSSNDYGRPLFVGTERYGFTNRLTGEIHAELLQDQQTTGIAGSYLIEDFGVVSAALVASRSDAGMGQLAALGFERTATRISFGANAEVSSDGFRRLGMVTGPLRQRMRAQVFTTMSLGRMGSLSLMATHQEYASDARRRLLTARHTTDLRGIGTLNFSATRIQGDQSDSLLSLSFTRSIGVISSNSGLTSDGYGTSAYTQLQKSMPAGTGFGYRMRAYSGIVQGLDAGASYQNDVGTYGLDVGQAQDDSRLRASATGGIALMGAGLFPSRRIDNSFAIARVGDHADVRVYRDNQLVGRTNANGYVILPGLRAYEDNKIRIEQADLPLDVKVGNLLQQAVPRYRSGLLLTFPIERTRGAVLTVLLEDGQPLPAGAEVIIVGETALYPTGLRGEVYIDHLADQTRLRASWGAQACEFDVAYTPSEDPLPKLGPFECRRANP